MKIILGSDLSFLLSHGYALTGIPKSEMKIGYVVTAAKGARHPDFFENVKTEIRKNGYPIDEYDIEGKTKEEILDFFSNKNIIQIEGGNTFYLLRAIRNSGFEEALKEMFEQGKVYIGISAGAYVMCPTIEVSNWDESGKDRFGITEFSALNYVPFFVKAHYKDEMFEAVNEKEKSLNSSLYRLRDGQGLLIENNSIIEYV